MANVAGLETRAVDLDHGEVVAGKAPTSVPLRLLARRGRDGEGLRGADDMVVRDDVALESKTMPEPRPSLVWICTTDGETLLVDVDERVLEGGRRPESSEAVFVAALLEAKPTPTATKAEATRIAMGILRSSHDDRSTPAIP